MCSYERNRYMRKVKFLSKIYTHCGSSLQVNLILQLSFEGVVNVKKGLGGYFETQHPKNVRLGFIGKRSPSSGNFRSNFVKIVVEFQQ